MDEAKIRQMVRKVVYRTLGVEQKEAKGLAASIPSPAPAAPKRIASSTASSTPKQSTENKPAFSLQKKAGGYGNPEPQRLVAIGADHGGYEMKEDLKRYLTEQGYGVLDCGTNSKDAVDYPDFAFAVGQSVAQGKAWRGIVIDGAGIGSCMAVNKIPGALAAMCYDHASAVNSREHNDANVLTLGAGLLGFNLARQIAKVWLETPHGGGRHAKRVDKIRDIERRFLK